MTSITNQSPSFCLECKTDEVLQEAERCYKYQIDEQTNEPLLQAMGNLLQLSHEKAEAEEGQNNLESFVFTDGKLSIPILHSLSYVKTIPFLVKKIKSLLIMKSF